MSSMSTWEMVVAVIGLVVISVLSRSLFFLSDRPWRLPLLVEKGLRYAPLAALSAVVAPEVMLTATQQIAGWQDPRYAATLAAVAWAAWRRDMLGTIVVGMGVLLGLRFGLGW